MDGEELLALEKRVCREGTGLKAADLRGCWQLELVWPKGNSRPAVFSGWLLRKLQARLEISGVHDDELQLTNGVTLGALELRFRGPGRLEGRRPLLRFHFTLLQLSFAGRVLLQRDLPAPAASRQPFFALIGRDASGTLAARGRGGGLALWRGPEWGLIDPPCSN